MNKEDILNGVRLEMYKKLENERDTMTAADVEKCLDVIKKARELI